MARGRRLVAEHLVNEYEAQLQRAVRAALAAQVLGMDATLRMHGLSSLTAAGVPSKRGRQKAAAGAAAGALVVPGLWDEQDWSQNVNEYVAPVAAQVSTAAAAAAVAAMGFAAATWGLVSSAPANATAITDRALGAGAAIGDRVNAAGVASGNPVADVSTVLSTAPDILGDQVGSMAGMLATMSTNDLAQYVTGMTAPTYLSATKTWNSQEDDRVREAHQDADGQEVALNETFQVGGEDLAGPGDPAGSDENIINCRCFMTVDGMVPEGSGVDDTGEGA